VGFSIGSKGYVGTGTIGSPYLGLNDFWEYDTATNTWARKADVGGTPRTNAAGFSVGSKGYIGTGNDAASNLKDFWEYDPAANSWTRRRDFAGEPRQYATGPR
jgi:N-acetylneuraminic acid mutarotase